MKIDSVMLKISDRFVMLYLASSFVTLLALYFSLDVLLSFALVFVCLFAILHMVLFAWAIKDA